MKPAVVFIAWLFAVSCADAQEARTSELFLTLKKQDSLLFEKGFNQCDIPYLESVIHKDLIFYHDQGGIQDRTKFFEAIKNNICNGTGPKPIRKVDEQSLEVFPMNSNGKLYGAIQTGTHRFYHREPGKADTPTSMARFTHLYLLVDGKWMLKEVLSYDHQEVK
jgi:hypothetical protein